MSAVAKLNGHNRTERSAIVIGAGLCGLGAAIGLSRAGFRVSVYERAKELTPAGFGIGITTNGMQALQHLGAYDAVAKVGSVAADAQIKTPKGELITVVPAKTIGDRVGVLTRIFHRAAIQQALLGELPADCLQLSARCVGVENVGNKARARFADGTLAEADLLIGADGVSSTVRALLHGVDELRFAHYVIWLSVMELKHPVLTPGYNSHYWGVGSRFGIHDIGNGQWYWWGTKNMAAVPERLRNLHLSRNEENRADKAELYQTFRDFPDEVRHAIQTTPDERVFLVNTRDRKPLSSWGRGRITLLGDAAHPMLTSLGQGAVMGFEDAAVLVRCLQSSSDVPRALAAYERLRIPRTTKVVEATRRMSAIEQVGDARAARLRNALFRRLPTVLVEKQLEAMSTFSMPDVERALRDATPSSDAPSPRTAEKPARIVLVTGASSGIGRALALHLAQSGFTVWAGVRNQAAAEELRKLGGPALVPVALDVTDANAIAHVRDELARATAAGSSLHALINNAAICVTGPLEAVPLTDLARQLEVNVVGAAAMVQATLPFLLESKGRIVQVGSNVGRLSPPFLGPYAASKAGLEALTDALRRELAPFGVSVSLVVPGPVMTPVWEKIKTSATDLMAHASEEVRRRYLGSLEKFFAMNHDTAVKSRLRPEDVAALIQHVLCVDKPRARYEIGFGATAGTVISRVLPASWVDLAFRQALKPSSTVASSAASSAASSVASGAP